MPKETLCDARVRAPWQLAELSPTTPVLLALSGGADSRYLLHVLSKMARRDGFPLLAAHVNHGIRGDEAIRDREFCRQICRDLGVELCVLDADVPRLAREHGRGLEEEAREVRYDYFATLMREREIPILVTAHNADDNAETVLFRLARGTSLAGLCGIAPVRPFADGYLVRPMLGLTKREILEACREAELEYVTDSTNADTVYTRNRLRAEVLPVLESLFPGATLRMGEMCEELREDLGVLTATAKPYVARYLAEDGCPLSEIKTLPVAVRRQVLVQWLMRARGVTPERVHVDAMLELIDAGVPHSRLSLPRDTRVGIEGGRLCIVRDPADEPIPYELAFAEGETPIPGMNWKISVHKSEKTLKVHNLSIAPYIILTEESAIMKNALRWRTRREGDRILMGGMHRSVRRLQREAGVSPEDRERLPILCRGEEILWVPFVGVRDGAGSTDPATEGVQVRLLLDDRITIS